MPEAVVGLTIVAVGTSLPELVTSAVAAIRKHGDVAFDNLVMVGVSLVAVVFAYTGRLVNRWEGGALVVGYAAYIAWLWP